MTFPLNIVRPHVVDLEITTLNYWPFFRGGVEKNMQSRDGLITSKRPMGVVGGAESLERRDGVKPVIKFPQAGNHKSDSPSDV